MRAWSVVVVAALVSFAPLQGSAQDPDPPRPGTGAVDFLLAHRDSLGLRPAQVARLEAVRDRLAERNRPHVERFVELRGRWQRERPAEWRRLGWRERRAARLRFQREVREEVRELREAIGRNNRAAVAEVRRVLTPAQRERARALLRARTGGGGP